MKEIIKTTNAPEAIGPYSQATRAGNLLFVSGQVSIDPKTKMLIGDDIKSQTRQALTNLKAIIEAAGLSLANVVKANIFMKDMKDFKEMNEVYASFFTEKQPARAAVEVAALPLGALVEIEAVAVAAEVME